MVTKTCPMCKKTFSCKNVNKIYCSPDCYVSYCRSRTRELNPKWHGGKLIADGYVYILKPGHPHATKLGYVLEHRLVMEKYLGRFLDNHEVVHHLNHDRSDNRIENLMLYQSTGKHSVANHITRDRAGKFAQIPH